MPSVLTGQVSFLARRVTFHSHLPNEQGFCQVVGQLSPKRAHSDLPTTRKISELLAQLGARPEIYDIILMENRTMVGFCRLFNVT